MLSQLVCQDRTEHRECNSCDRGKWLCSNSEWLVVRTGFLLYMERLDEDKKNEVITSSSDKVFKFGNGIQVKSFMNARTPFYGHQDPFFARTTHRERPLHTTTKRNQVSGQGVAPKEMCLWSRRCLMSVTQWYVKVKDVMTTLSGIFPVWIPLCLDGMTPMDH